MFFYISLTSVAPRENGYKSYALAAGWRGIMHFRERKTDGCSMAAAILHVIEVLHRWPWWV